MAGISPRKENSLSLMAMKKRGLENGAGKMLRMPSQGSPPLNVGWGLSAGR